MGQKSIKVLIHWNYILGTENLYEIVNERIAKQYNKIYTWELHATQMGQKAENCAKLIIDGLKLPMTIEEFVSLGNKHRIELFPQAKLMAGLKS